MTGTGAQMCPEPILYVDVHKVVKVTYHTTTGTFTVHQSTTAQVVETKQLTLEMAFNHMVEIEKTSGNAFSFKFEGESICWKRKEMK